MKKITAIALLMCFICILACSCGKTPDVAAEESKVTSPDQIEWKFAIEGVDGVTEYTKAQAEQHELTKVYCSLDVSGSGDVTVFPTTMIIEGVLFSDFLADIGMSDATSCTYSGYSLLWKEDQSFTIDQETMNADDLVIGWIVNKTDAMVDSETYVGVNSGDVMVTSITNLETISFN